MEKLLASLAYSARLSCPQPLMTYAQMRMHGAKKEDV